MNRQAITDLAVHTLRAPQDAARQIMSLPLSRDALWTSLALVAAVNTFLFMLSLQIAPDSPGMPGIFREPLAFFVILTGVLVVMVHGLFWTGRAMGGQGDLGDMLVLVIWLQALRAIAQAAVLVIMAVSLNIAAILSLMVGFAGIWILVNFIAAAFRFPSLAQAVGVLVVAMLGALVGAVVLGTLITLTVLGVPADV